MGVELVVRSPEGERVVALDTRVVVGRDAQCDVCINSFRLSRQHAEFVLGPSGVTVRDLESRNGVFVNGAKVRDAMLQPTDRVVLGDVGITLRGTAPRATAPEPTVATVRSQNAAIRWVTPAAPPAAGASQAFDKTMLLSGRPVAAAGPPQSPSPGVAAQPATATRVAQSMSRRVSFAARMSLVSAGAGALAFIVTAVPLTQAAAIQSRRSAVTHAATLARLLAAENAAALADSQALAATVRTLQIEPGVRNAVVMTAQGRTLAPPDRLDETVSAIPALGELAWLRGLQTAWHDGQVEAAAVVETAGHRAGIVWVTYDPGYAGLGATALGLSLGASALTALAVGLVASLFTGRMLARRLEAFAVDVDLAVCGQLSALEEHQGIPALSRPIESINYAIARGRSPLAPPPAGASPREPARAAAPPPASAPPLATPGTLVLDSTFIVRTADAASAQLLGATVEALVGHHVLEAIADQVLAGMIIDCLNDLDGAAEVARSVDGSSGRAIEARATRTEPSGAVTFVLRSV